MEKIYYDDSTYIWKTKFNRINEKQLFLEEANSVIKSMPHVTNDGYGYKRTENGEVLNIAHCGNQPKLDEIIEFSTNCCKEIYNEKNINYNKINSDIWINVVRANNPTQYNFQTDEKYHTHTDISKANGRFIPYYTWVYYIQMPDIMYNEDGVLYFKSKDGKEYWVKPEEDDLIIMEGDIPHSPNTAPNSTLDRIVIAGNIGFEYIKKEKTLI